MMKSSIYLFIAYAALSTAQQLNSGPKISKEVSTSAASRNSNKRYATQEVILYLTPSEIKGLQALKNGNNKDSLVGTQREQQLSLQNDNIEEQQKAWVQYFKSLESEESKQQQQNVFYPKTRPAFENQGVQDSVDSAYKYGWEQINNEQQQVAKNQQERQREESQWIPFNPVSAKKQEEALLHEQLQQQWNRILNHNRAQLKGLSSISSENQRPEVSNGNERLINQWQSPSRKQEQKKSDVEKQIENILKEASNLEKQSEAERYSQQRPPVVIHKEVRIINHHSVPVVEKVKVSVPRPVLVPVPEPYEVKVPHPYPVPLEIIKHIPIPILSNK